jgi:hypothetical protein
MGTGEWEHIRRAAYEGKKKEEEKGQREIEERQTALFLAFSPFFSLFNNPPSLRSRYFSATIPPSVVTCTYNGVTNKEGTHT